MSDKKVAHIQQPCDNFVSHYPRAVEFTKQQQSQFWVFDETNPENDKHDLLVNMTEAERHGVTTTLKTFTLLEKLIGSFWGDFVCKRFPRDGDIIPMATMFSAIEVSVHEKFYAIINETMGLATEDFYEQYKYDPILKSRIDSMMDTLAHKDDLRTLGGFSFFEGAILFSSFAFLKSFQLNGNNKIMNIVAGLNFSVSDEMLHCDAAAWLYTTLKQQQLELGIIDEQFVEELEADIVKAGRDVYEHELLLLDKLFEKGDIEGMCKEDIAAFVRHRVNECLKRLEIAPIYDESYNPLAKPFYDSVKGYSSTDFFSSQGSQYTRGWSENGFKMGKAKGKKKVAEESASTGAQ